MDNQVVIDHCLTLRALHLRLVIAVTSDSTVGALASDGTSTHSVHSDRHPTRQAYENLFRKQDKPTTDGARGDRTQLCQRAAIPFDAQGFLRNTRHTSAFGGADERAVASCQ